MFYLVFARGIFNSSTRMNNYSEREINKLLDRSQKSWHLIIILLGTPNFSKIGKELLFMLGKI